MSSGKVHSRNIKYKEDWKNEYIDTVFLNYVGKGRSEYEICNEKHFDKDIKIQNNKAILNQMLKEGYVKREKTVSIASTVRGRKFLSEGVISLTKEGEEFLQSRKDLIMFFDFATPYINIHAYQRAKKRVKRNAGFETTMIALLIEKLNKCRRNDDYIGVKNIFFDVGELYKQTSSDSRAMYAYIASLYFDVNGLEYYGKFLDYLKNKITRKELKNSYEGIYINPQTIARIKTVKAGYISGMADHIYEKNHISINLCPKREFKKLISDIANDKFSYIEWQNFFSRAFDAMILVADRHKNK